MTKPFGSQRGRLSFQTKSLEEGEQVLGGESEFHPDLVANRRKGKLRSPLSLPQRMRSST